MQGPVLCFQMLPLPISQGTWPSREKSCREPHIPCTTCIVSFPFCHRPARRETHSQFTDEEMRPIVLLKVGLCPSSGQRPSRALLSPRNVSKVHFPCLEPSSHLLAVASLQKALGQRRDRGGGRSGGSLGNRCSFERSYR